MADMSKIGKKEFPSQTENRRAWIIDTVRENQPQVIDLLIFIIDQDNYGRAKSLLANMHKSDRDALLQPNGILTPEQIELLKE